MQIENHMKRLKYPDAGHVLLNGGLTLYGDEETEYEKVKDREIIQKTRRAVEDLIAAGDTTDVDHPDGPYTPPVCRLSR